jgi:hypothetical protein
MDARAESGIRSTYGWRTKSDWRPDQISDQGMTVAVFAIVPLQFMHLLVLMALERCDMPEPDYDELKLICSSFNSALRNQAAKGGLVMVEGRPVRWALEWG